MHTESSSEQPACSYLHPGGIAAQDLSRAHTKLCSQAGWVYIELQAGQPTVHILRARPPLLFNLNPKACRMAISMLERRFLEFNSCCQIQLAPGSQSSAGIFPGSPVPGDLCTGLARTSTSQWGWSQAFRVEVNHESAKHVWADVLSRMGSTTV